MKRIALLSALLIVGAVSFGQAQDRRAEKEAKRQKEREATAVVDMGKFDAASQAIQDRSFVIEVNQIQGQYGRIVYVTPNDNFVSLNGNNSTVQLAFNNGVPGLNGAGGVTLGGTITNVKTRTDKHGNVVMQYFLQGNSISATIIVTLFYGDNRASVVMNATFSNGRINFFGRLLPSSQSDVFKANPNIIVPRGLN